jgi:hypothetical protein
MSEPDRVIAERLHAVIKANAPALTSKLWYGMPAYARNGKVVCFFQSAAKFKTRYAMLGFSDEANLDEGAMWPTYFALHEADAQRQAGGEVVVRPGLLGQFIGGERLGEASGGADVRAWPRAAQDNRDQARGRTSSSFR